MQQFKELWKRLPEAEQEHWREQFNSARRQADLRAEIFRKFDIKLSQDRQLSLFRVWLEDQDQRDAQAEWMNENEARLTAKHPEWTLDQIREAVIRASYSATLATGDFQLGLKTIVQDLNVKKVTLDRDKFEFDAAKAALDAIDTLRKIKSNSGLTEEEKIQQARLELFGEEAVSPEGAT